LVLAAAAIVRFMFSGEVSRVPVDLNVYRAGADGGGDRPA